MQCSECQSTHIRKNDNKKGKQNHICVKFDLGFINDYEPQA
jgi:insertion element IS1 protein InsB